MSTPVLFGNGLRPFDCIRLIDVDVMVACGLHTWERHPERPNRLRVNVHLFSYTDVDHTVAAPWGGFIDYDRVRTAILDWRQRPHTDLLETLVEDLLATCFADPRVDGAYVSVIKPEIFPEAAGAGVEAFRLRPADV
jgi:dihydroneopterin aldolase